MESATAGKCDVLLNLPHTVIYPQIRTLLEAKDIAKIGFYTERDLRSLWSHGVIRSHYRRGVVITLSDFLDQTDDWGEPIYVRQVLGDREKLPHFEQMNWADLQNHVHRKKLSPGIYRLSDQRKMMFTCTNEDVCDFVNKSYDLRNDLHRCNRSKNDCSVN